MKRPSLDQWLAEARAEQGAENCGMYLFHTGVVRETPKAAVREGVQGLDAVRGMEFSYDREKLAAAIERAKKLPGIFHIRVWLNEGRLSLGEEIMLVLVGGDIRPHVIDALQSLVGEIKTGCVIEKEL